MTRTAGGWFGILPDHWTLTRLGALGTLEKGRGGSKEDNRESGVPVLRYGDLYSKHGIYVERPTAYIDVETAAGYTGLPEGSVVFAASGESADEIGKAALVRLETPSVVGGDTVLLHPISTVDARFLVYLLDSHPLRSYKAIRSTGFTVVHISAGRLKTLPIPLPPLAEQSAIADYLDRETARIDALIGKQGTLIETLRERRASVVERETIARPRDGRIKHAADVTLGKMLDAGKALKSGDQVTPYVRAADVLHDGSINLTDLNTMPFSPEELARLDLRMGDVLVIEGGATVGKPGYLNVDVDSIAFQKTINRVRARSGASHGRYLFWTLSAMYASGYYSRAYVTVSFVHLTAEKLREVSIPLPSLDEQRRIADYLDEQTAKIDALIANAEHFIEVSKERRSALITAVVTGQIDVRERVTVSAAQSQDKPTLDEEVQPA